MSMIGEDLTKLIKTYAVAEPNRARGGIVAITGFEYQIWSYLADFAIALSSNDLVSGGTTFVNAFETLSDYTRGSETGTVCVQAKHHLDSSTMSQAAAEFAAIERFLQCHVTSGLQNKVQYEVIARSGAMSLSWDDIQLPASARAREPDLSFYFEKLRENGRLLKPRFEPDPQWRLIAAVYKDLTDPFGFARRAFELCFRRSREPGSAAFVRGAIAEDYAVHLRSRPHMGRPLSASDFVREVQGSGLSLAKTPTLSDLRSGRFMERATRVSEVLAVLKEIGHANRGSMGPAIPVLWMDGRSGCGKSVLLLQVMEHLVVKDQASVIWFANGVGEATALLEQIIESDTHLMPSFVVVDDIYDPQARDDLDLPRLTRLVVHSGCVTWPVLITCGPTEFRQDFERDCRAEGFRITPWHLRTLEPAETTELRNWFHSRTGRLPKPAAASTEQHALMLSVMFELEHGDLRPFANRFRNRLAQEQLDGVLSIPLALNRLYIWTPRQWLSTDEEARLERLNQDGDFSILSLEGRGDLFKVTHPHLSDAIYRALHPQAIPATFSRHLITAFSQGLASHLPTALRLLRVVSSHPPRLDIVDEENLAAGMTQAWNSCDKIALHHNTAAEAWVDWAKWAARRPSVVELLGVSPLATAIEMLDGSHPRWPLLWSLLWSGAPGEAILTNRALEWLASHFEADGWNLVWWRVTEQSMQYSRELNVVTDNTNRLCQMGLDWLNVSSNSPGWARVWNQLILAPDLVPSQLREKLITIGVEWVRTYPQSRSWTYVWESLATMSQKEAALVSRSEMYELGFKWLNEHANHPGWAFVWQHFMSINPLPIQVASEQLFQLALTWSSGREDNPGWVYVTSRLAEEATNTIKKDTFDRLITWLQQHPDSSGWHAVWYHLFDLPSKELTPKQRQRLFLIANQWVAADDEREYVLFILTHLIRKLHWFIEVVDETGVIDETELVNRACAALARTVTGEDRSWVQLRDVVALHVRGSSKVNFAEVQKTLQHLGKVWLDKPEHLSHRAWSQVYRVVYRIGTDDEGVHRSLALRGIVQGLIPDPGPFAAQLYSSGLGGPPPDELIDWLRRWFSGPAKDSGGFSVWVRLSRATDVALTQKPDEEQWLKLRELLDFHQPDQLNQWRIVLEHYRERRPIVGRVMKKVQTGRGRNGPRRSGYVVDVGVNAFLSEAETGLESRSQLEQLALINKTLEFDIIRLDEIRLQVDLSRRTFLDRQTNTTEKDSE